MIMAITPPSIYYLQPSSKFIKVQILMLYQIGYMDVH